MTMTKRKALVSLLVGSLTQFAWADEREEALINRNTTLNLIEALVKKGVLDRASADAMIRDAKEKAVSQTKAELAREETAAPRPNGAGKKGQSIHVSYVPQIVKNELRREVREELRDEVVREVKAQAKSEKWGIPAALPDWIDRIQPFFDMRIRVADEFYSRDNGLYYDWLQINKDGGIFQALQKNQAFLNNTKDRFRVRERFRLGFDARLTDDVKAGFRFATSNIRNPVSNDQSLGNTGQSWEIAIDRAFLQYDYRDGQGNDWFSVWGGRMPNPFVSTDVVYDPDLSFEGVAAAFRWHFNQADANVKTYHPLDPTARFGLNLGPQTPDSAFATFGVFPIQEVNFSSSDKWLFGGQAGADWLVFDESRAKFAVSYYDFHNVAARRNAFNSRTYDWSAPQFIQRGNSLVAINDAKNQPDCGDNSLGAQNVCLVGLASDFRIFNATAFFDYAAFAPLHVLFTVDYAKNLGFDRNRIVREFGERIAPRTDAYQVRVDVGRQEISHFGDWSATFAYRYVERDAVLDAFTDSIFHQGGSDAKGWVLGVQYGLARQIWLNLRWLSTTAVDGPHNVKKANAKFDIDTVNLDLNARF